MVETWIDKNIQSQNPIKESNILDNDIMDTPITNADLGKNIILVLKSNV